MSEAAIAVREDHAAPVAQAQTETAAIISVIERAARDPNVDIDKMERLMLMQERAMEKRAKAAYASALALMQPRLPSIKERGGIKDRNGRVQSTYALWEDINDAIKPVLAEHGFALNFRITHPDNMVAVTGVLLHEEGHSEETTIRLPHDASGSKNAVQAVASSVSYGKRYTAGALLNLTSHGEDDDGRGPVQVETISEDQAGELVELIDSVGADRAGFLRFFKVAALSELPADKFQQAVAMLNAKRGRG